MVKEVYNFIVVEIINLKQLNIYKKIKDIQ